MLIAGRKSTLESELSLLDAAIDAVATMIEIYRRRFYN